MQILMSVGVTNRTPTMLDVVVWLSPVFQCLKRVVIYAEAEPGGIL